MNSSWWRPCEDDKLRLLMAKGYDLDYIADKIGRTYYGVKARAGRLKIKRAEKTPVPFWRVAARHQLLAVNTRIIYDYIEECVSAIAGLPAEGR